MCNNFPNIRITEGNNFSLVLPLRSRTYVATKPIDEDIDPAQLENVVVTFGGVEYPAQITAQGVQIDLPATLAVGTYNILLTAEYLDSSIRAAYESAVTIVPWSAQSTAEQYITGSPIVMRAAYVLSGAMTDAELEALKEEWREKNAQLDEAIEEYERRAAELDGVAQEETLTQGVQDIRTDISHIDIDTSTLAKETTAEAAKQVAQVAATQAEAAKIAAQAAETTAQGTANKNEILAAIAANAGIPTMTIPNTTAAQELAPNVLYIFENRTSELTLTLGAAIVGRASEYHFFIICGATAPTVNFPTDITWNGGSAPTIAADKTYEISILNNVAAYFEV
jgi:hypothetical protein